MAVIDCVWIDNNISTSFFLFKVSLFVPSLAQLPDALIESPFPSSMTFLIVVDFSPLILLLTLQKA